MRKHFLSITFCSIVIGCYASNYAPIEIAQTTPPPSANNVVTSIPPTPGASENEPDANVASDSVTSSRSQNQRVNNQAKTRANNNSGNNNNSSQSTLPTYEGLKADGALFEFFGLLQCNQPGFRCVEVRPTDNWYSLFPNDTERNIVMRLNRTNVDLRYRKWLVVPIDWKNISYQSLSPLPSHFNPPGKKKLIVIDLKRYAFGAYDEKGNIVYWGPAAGGQDLCPDEQGKNCASATGTFKVYRMDGPDCISHKYPIETHGGAPMPWCLFYHGGDAIHGSTMSGFVDRSRGCIRLFYEDAQWLHDHFAQIGTEVIVTR